MALSVTALVRVAGFHSWPQAPPARAYLAQRHRHLFHVRACVAVDDVSRAIEFHDLAAYITDVLRRIGQPYGPDDSLLDFGFLSCEAIASMVALELEPDALWVSCSEDDEFTATWTKDPAP